MSKVKYYYDSETLSYRSIEPKKGKKAINISLFFVAAFLFRGICLLILLNTSLVSTPQEPSQARELRNYEFQFELLNKKMAQVEQVLENIEDRDNNIYRVYFEANPIPNEQRSEERRVGK